MIEVFINVRLHQLCTLQDTVMRPTHFFVIMVDEHFSTTGALPSQPTLVMRIRYQSISVLLGTLDSTQLLLQYYNPLSWSPLGMLDYARIDLEPT